jgi:hypothetical protein
VTEKPIESDKGANSPRRKSPWGLALQLSVLALAVVSAIGAAKLARQLRAPTGPTPAPAASARKMPSRFFRGWDKPTRPDFVLVLSGQQHGYVLPCGCSRPQVGGLERRYNLVRLLKERGWPVVALDLGDVPQKEGPLQLPNVQGLIKYRYSLHALKAMGYQAVGIGEYEAALPLFSALGEFALQEHGNPASPQTLAANLLDRKEKFPEQVDSWRLVTAPGAATKVGVTCVVGPTVAAKIKDKDVKFSLSSEAIRTVLKEMGEKGVELPVLLYQGGSRDPKAPKPEEAIACAETFKTIPLIVCLCETDEPPAFPLVVNRSGFAPAWVLRLGHKGKNIGVVGVWRTGRPDRPFEYRYQMVDLGEEFLTPPGEEKSNPVLDLMESYTKELRGDPRAHPGGDYLGRYGQNKHMLQVLPATAEQKKKDAVATYVGSERCGDCHEEAYKVWKGSKHSHAYQTLLDAKRPSLRQYDPECIVCHTVGFGHQGGFRDAVATPKLMNVGCESCHGPGSLHASNPTDKEWAARMNLLWKAPEKETADQKRRRLDKIDQFCQRCHDTDNDVNWKHDEKSGKGGFERKWPEIQHYEKKLHE